MKEQKSFVKNFLIIGSGTLLNMVVGFITTPIITRLVSTEKYGQYSIFTMYASIALMVLCLGLDQALIRFFYKDDSIDYQRTILRECWVIPVIISVAVGIVVNILCRTGCIQMEFDNSVVMLLTICVILQIINRIDLILLRVTYKTKLYSILSFAYKTIFAVLSVIGCKFFGGDPFRTLVIATVLGYGIVVVTGVLAQHDLWAFWKIKEKFKIDRKELYTYAFPFIISMGITTFFQAIDKISLNFYCTYSEVGIYSSAMTLVHIFAIVQTTFNAMWAPSATEHFEKNPDDKEYHRRGNRVITLVMYFIGISLILVKDVFALLLGPAYREAAYILPFLIFNPIMLTISETTVGGIVFMKKSHMQIVVALIGCITNIIGNVILVPIYGCRGAAISTGIAYIAFFAARTYIANHYYKVDWKLGRFWAFTAYAVFYAAYNSFNSFGWITVCGYIIGVIMLIVLYKDAVQDCLAISKKYYQKLKMKAIRE